MTIPAGLLLLAKVIDLLTCGNLKYKEAQGESETRAEAAAKIVHSDGVRLTDTLGYYRVRSSHLVQDSEPIYYRVVVDGSELSCECQDRNMRALEWELYGKATKEQRKELPPPEMMICRHIIAASMVAAMSEVL